MTEIRPRVPHSGVGLGVVLVHVDGPLAVLHGEVVLLALVLGGGAVAVEHLVRRVKLDGSGN